MGHKKTSLSTKRNLRCTVKSTKRNMVHLSWNIAKERPKYPSLRLTATKIPLEFSNEGEITSDQRLRLKPRLVLKLSYAHCLCQNKNNLTQGFAFLLNATLIFFETHQSSISPSQKGATQCAVACFGISGKLPNLVQTKHAKNCTTQQSLPFTTLDSVK